MAIHIPELKSEESLYKMLHRIADGQETLLSRMDDIMDRLSSSSTLMSTRPTFPAPLHTHRSQNATAPPAVNPISKAASFRMPKPKPAAGPATSPTAAAQPPPVPIPKPPPRKPKPVVEEAPPPKGIVGTLQHKVVYADSFYRGVLHTVLCIMATIEFITVTSAVVHEPEDTPHMTAFCWILLLGMNILLTVELLLNLNTAIHRNKWEIVDNVKNSRKEYMKLKPFPPGWFWWDLLVTVPWDLFALAAQGGAIASEMSLQKEVTAFSIMVLFRCVHIARVPFYFRRRNPILDLPRWVHFIHILMAGSLTIHMLGVIWMLMATEEEQKIGHDNGGDDGFAYQYIQAINYGFQSFVHGKSDAYGHHTKTAAYGLTIKIVGFLVIAMIEAKLAEFFVNHDPFHGLARQRQQQLASLIVHNGVPWEVQKNIMSIYPSLMQANMRDYYNIMNDLPPFLSAQITKYIKMRLISAVPMFTQTSEDCREALATVLIEDMLAPGYDVVTRGDVATSMYFLMHGMVEVLILKDGEEICLTTLKEGSWFGEIALLQDTTRTASVRAATAVKVYRLEKSDFNDLAERFPELRAKIQEVANARMQQMAKKDDKPPPAASSTPPAGGAAGGSGSDDKKDDKDKGNEMANNENTNNGTSPPPDPSHGSPPSPSKRNNNSTNNLRAGSPARPYRQPSSPKRATGNIVIDTSNDALGGVNGINGDDKRSCSLSSSDDDDAPEEVLLDETIRAPFSPINERLISSPPPEVHDILNLPGETNFAPKPLPPVNPPRDPANVTSRDTPSSVYSLLMKDDPNNAAASSSGSAGVSRPDTASTPGRPPGPTPSASPSHHGSHTTVSATNSNDPESRMTRARPSLGSVAHSVTSRGGTNSPAQTGRTVPSPRPGSLHGGAEKRAWQE